MWSRVECKERAKALLKQNYWMCFLVCLVIALVSGQLDTNGIHISVQWNEIGHTTIQNGWSIANSLWHGVDFMWPFSFSHGFHGLFFLWSILLALASFAFGILVVGPLEVGKARYFLHHAHGQASLGDIFSVFSDGAYWNIVKIMFLRNLKLLLWTLCFIIPGIYKLYEYRMIPYLLAQDGQLSTDEAFNQTALMTKDQKIALLILDVSFLGWFLLGGLFFGIGQIFVYPYTNAVNTQVYLASRHYEQQGWM